MGEPRRFSGYIGRFSKCNLDKMATSPEHGNNFCMAPLWIYPRVPWKRGDKHREHENRWFSIDTPIILRMYRCWAARKYTRGFYIIPGHWRPTELFTRGLQHIPEGSLLSPGKAARDQWRRRRRGELGAGGRERRETEQADDLVLLVRQIAALV